MSGHKPLKLAILWHMHQPDYQQPGENRMVLPWVRLHAIKDYLDMPLRAARHENIKVTFNLVPSLLDQLDIYLNGGTDRHLELSRLKTDEMSRQHKVEILKTFFTANPLHMIKPHHRYNELYKKLRADSAQLMPDLFTSTEIRDLQVWSNLAWVDPLFYDEEPIRSLLGKGKNYTEAEKHALLDWQLATIKRIVPGYRELYEQGKIDISFTPYYHPILPLLCDTDIAKMALPDLELPKRRFIHPEDASRQITLAAEKFESLFGHPLQGMWPSEGSVSEEVARLCAKASLSWIATDEDILYHSLKRSGVERAGHHLHAPYDYGPGLKIFFRDRALSDRVGFVYSGWEADKAVDDFIFHLKNIRKTHLDDLENSVVSVILDGENAWEYFPRDGAEFLETLYQRLSEEEEIETVTFSQAANELKPKELKSLFAGSWINHNFKIWIGHAEDNAAWDLLGKTRDALVNFEKDHAGFDKQLLDKAWQQIYKAEGSDWCWWYGDEHRGNNNEQFDAIFREHLISVYKLLKLDVPLELYTPIYQSGRIIKAIEPDSLITPAIDGRLTHFYEWSGAGYYDCLKAASAMHRGDQFLKALRFGYDQQNFYIRLDFVDIKAIKSLKEPGVRITMAAEHEIISDLPVSFGERGIENNVVFCVRDFLEAAVERSGLWNAGYGILKFSVSLIDEGNIVETWPATDFITIEVAQKDKELFWPS